MKVLARNCKTIYYALVQAETDTYDEYGNLTGSPRLTYSTPVKARMVLGRRTGSIALTPNGLEDNYEQRLMTDDMACPISTGTILWIDAAPTDANGNAVSHTHEVSAVIPTLNSITYRVEEVAKGL